MSFYDWKIRRLESCELRIAGFEVLWPQAAACCWQGCDDFVILALVLALLKGGNISTQTIAFSWYCD